MALNTIGQCIREIRIDRKLTQEELSYLCDITPVYLSHIETGNAIPSVKVLIKIALALKTSANSIFKNVIPYHDSEYIYDSEIALIMKDCSPSEKMILTDILRAAKESLRSRLK